MKATLSAADLKLIKTFSKACRHSILAMTTNAGSGHPGGSLSSIDFLSLLYTQIIGTTGEPVVVSNGHISPAVYAVLSEMGYVNKQDVLKTFRKAGSIFEGHVTRLVSGVWYGTGPLGVGISAASGLSWVQKYKKTNKKVYAIMGDGESQEGQIYEMINFAHKYRLNNLIAFLDYNKVQLSDGLATIMPLDPPAFFRAGGWQVLEVNGHNLKSMWRGLKKAQTSKKPTILIGHTIMGKGTLLMEPDGKKYRATWHGQPGTAEEIAPDLHALALSKVEEQQLAAFRKTISWKPKPPATPKPLSVSKIKTGKPRLYKPDEPLDCRSAYGKALLDLTKLNKKVIALTADLADSVKTGFVRDALPEQHLDCGVAEQQMVSCAGGMSLDGIIPFCSTFGVFMTSRAKGQVRMNDLNRTNVKMVASHCGLSHGFDGPSHQALDDNNSVLGLLNTMQIEPADANHTDRIIRYVAKRYGNFYVRLGRHKYPVLTKENGRPFYDTNYTYVYGKCDLIRKGTDLTIAAIGATASEALRAVETLRTKGVQAELVVVSSIKQFDRTLTASIKKTKRVLTVEDHNIHSGLGNQLSAYLFEHNIAVKSFKSLGVKSYQSSGTAEALYKKAGIDSGAIVKSAMQIY